MNTKLKVTPFQNWYFYNNLQSLKNTHSRFRAKLKLNLQLALQAQDQSSPCLAL